MHGICVDAMNPANRPTLADLELLGATGVRIAPRYTAEFDSYARALITAGLTLALVLDRDAFPDGDYGRWAGYWADAYAPAAIVIGNEPDAILTPEENDASWEMDPASYRALWDACAPEIRAASPQTRLCLAGQMLGDGRWLRQLFKGGRPDGASLLDLHLYYMERDTASVARGREAIQRHRATFGIDVAVFEWTTPDEDIVAFARMLRQEAIASTWFCWGGVDGHGVIRPDGTPYPTLWALKAGLAPYDY